MKRLFRKRDIDQMKATDVSQDFVDYFNRLSEDRRNAFAEERPDLFTAISSFTEVQDEAFEAATPAATGEALSVQADLSKPEPPEDTDSDDAALTEIKVNIYAKYPMPQLIKDDFRPIEALSIDDGSKKCPAHRILLERYNPKFHDRTNGMIFGMYFYYCPKCNRLFIERSRLEKDREAFEMHDIPCKLYDFELSKRYLLTQTEPYRLADDEKIYIPDVWIEEAPTCPIHDHALEKIPCVREYKARHISFSAYYCDDCKKVILRKAHKSDLDDQCAQIGIPYIQQARLAKAKTPKTPVSTREIIPDYFLEEGKREEYNFGNRSDFYKLTERDTVVVSDAVYCNLDGHDTKTVLGLIWVRQRQGKEADRRSYLVMLGYCTECQKYYMDEVDYKTIYSIGRPEVTILIDIDDNSFMISSGEVFELEKKHLKAVEDTIDQKVEEIHQAYDYVNPYETCSYNDDGDLATRKYVSKIQYSDCLELLVSYTPKPYEYRVDISSDRRTEVYYIGATDINLDGQHQVISANSPFGRKLVHYKTIDIERDGRRYDIMLSRQFDINNAVLYGYTNLRTNEDITFKKGITDPFLVKVLNMRKRQHNLIDIFVTIQERQNEIVDAPFERDLIVQGCAGSGKTMVLLHRLSSLKYNRPDLDLIHHTFLLTPNDHFTTHIKGIAEGLQIGSVARSSVERYYADMLQEYSPEFKIGGKIASEMLADQGFVDYVYSYEFRYSFEMNYANIIAAQKQLINRLQSLSEQMAEPERMIDGSDDNRIVQQMKLAANLLASKVDAKEKEVQAAEAALHEQEERKNSLARDIPKTRRDTSEKLWNELYPKAREKAVITVAAIQKEIGESTAKVADLESEKDNVEKLIAGPVDIGDEDSFNHYLATNHEWKDSAVGTLLTDVTDIRRRILRKETELRRTAMISAQEIITSESCEDVEIARLIGLLAEAGRHLTQLQQERAKTERGWMAVGKKRRLSEIDQQIRAIEETISTYKDGVYKLVDEHNAQFEKRAKEIEQLHKDMESKKSEIVNSIEKSKQKKLDSLKRLISALSGRIQSKKAEKQKLLETIDLYRDGMSDDDVLTWVKRIAEAAVPLKEELQSYTRLHARSQRQESEYASIDEKIAEAQARYDTAMAERYSESIRESVQSIQQELADCSALKTYQKVFHLTVAPYREEHGIKTISGSNHRYDLYAQLIFVMKYYGKALGHVKFMCIDEGQDLALNEYRLIYELNMSAVTFNIFGDTNQLMKPNRGISDWHVITSIWHAAQYTLNENYRNTNQITRFCNDSFGMTMLQTGVDGAKTREITEREFRAELSDLHVATERVAVLLPKWIDKQKYLKLDTPSLEVRDKIGEEIDTGRISVMYVDEVKGIEFDKVYVIPNRMARNEKYIAYTRALSELIIVVNESAPVEHDERAYVDE